MAEGCSKDAASWRELLKDGQPPNEREWWINFYHVMDPVSGALSSPVLCDHEPPANFHARSGWIPGWAHVAYWTDSRILRFILGRTYGKEYVRDREYRPLSRAVSVLGYFVWAVILFGLAFAIIRWAPLLTTWALNYLKGRAGI